MRRCLALVLAVPLVAGACGKSSDNTAATTTTAAKTASPQTYGVVLDAKTDAFNGEFATYSPSTLSAHPGDTVKFSLPRFSGVPHTVTFGTLVDSAVAKLDQLGPQALPVAQEETPEMLKLPDVFPHGAPQGPPSPNQSAAQPCYLDAGVPPLALPGGAAACPKMAQPDFDGTQAFYNSGMLAKDGDAFEMKLSSSIKPGTYAFMCMIHRGVMTAKLTVAASGETIPSPAEVTTAGQKQIDDLVAKVKPAADAAQKVTPDKATIGTGDPTTPNVVVADFGPKSISIPVGGTVTWSVFAFHSLAFNATDADVGVANKQADGSWAFAPKAGPPAGFNVPPAAFTFPPPATSKPLMVDLGSYDGTGFKNTGIVGSVPPQFISFKLKFTKAGTIPFRCLVHPDMKGEIKVG